MGLRSRLAGVLLTSLVACAPATQAPAHVPMEYAPPIARNAKTPDDVRRLTLLPEDATHEGTLVDGRGAPVCQLPCTAWVPSDAGWSVDVAVSGGRPRRIEIPDDIAPGESTAAVVKPKRGHPGAALTLLITGIPLSLLGGLALGASINARSEVAGVRETDWIGVAWGIGLLAVGVPMLVGGSAWSQYSRFPSIEPRP